MADELIRLDDPQIEIALRRSAQARRFTLSVRPGADAPSLTAPRRASRGEMLAFLERQRPWLRAALARRIAPQVARPGAEIPVFGRPRRIAADPLIARICRLEGDRLIAPARETGLAVAAFLKEQARERLAAETARAAAVLGARLGRVSFRDMRSRWGSCTARGDISLSWRLAMAAPEIGAYVARHEAAHLREMNHGARFWAHVAELDPDWRAHRDDLRREGAKLLSWRF